MKIGIDARLWSETGVGRYIRNLVTELQTLDKKNEYVLFVRKADYDKVSSQISNNKFKIKVADIRWHTVEEQVKFPQILNKENLDLVHFPYFSVPVAYKKPFVMTIHDLIINHFPTGKASTLPQPLYQLKRIGYKHIVSSAMKNAKKIIVPLNAVKDDLIKTLDVPESKIMVTTEGFDEGILHKVTSSHLPNAKYFLYIGNAYPHKNLERLVEAFVEFKKEEEDVQLLLVGKEDYFYKQLSQQIKNAHLEDSIVFVGQVHDEELANIYKNAIALLSPSLMEGFGLPALEAMALNCLVVVSDIPSFREVCQDAAIYFDPYSIEDIKEKMKFAFSSDKKSRQEYIKKGLRRVNNFSWKKMAQETLNVYESSFSLR